ncbi:MAG: hypothetical protein PHX53_10835 [Syntrophales bacterium]|nr:hypothetical protein [Syntrophales bacterium]
MLRTGLDAREIMRLVEHYRAEGFADSEELLDFVEAFWGLRIPRVKVCPEHTPPAEYVTAAFFEEVQNSVCWANRGGGKTLNGALATWLDAVFKPGCETKILGGSLEQSQKMYSHIKERFATPPFIPLVKGEMLKTHTKMVGDGSIQILTASSKSVRGPHPQKLKLDEVDEMDPEIYEAALFIPQTAKNIKASIHIYSTMHKAYGLMNQVITEAAQSGYRIFKWCILDVLEKCEGRDCYTCALLDDCGGRARNADGFIKIEDAITKKRMASREAWNSEALCLMPSQEGLIYKEFDISVHVVSDEEMG